MKERFFTVPEIVSYSVRNGELLGVQKGTYGIVTLAKLSPKEERAPLAEVPPKRRGPNKVKKIPTAVVNGATPPTESTEPTQLAS